MLPSGKLMLLCLSGMQLASLPRARASDVWVPGGTACVSGCGQSQGAVPDDGNPGLFMPAMLSAIPVLVADIYFAARLVCGKSVKIDTRWVEVTIFVSGLVLAGCASAMIVKGARPGTEVEVEEAKMNLGFGTAFLSLALPALAGSTASFFLPEEEQPPAGALLHCRGAGCKLRLAAPTFSRQADGSSAVGLGLISGSF